MKIADVKKELDQILAHWSNDSTASDKYGDHFGFYFYGWLQENRPDLLRFKCSGDPYQKINCMVMDWQRKNKKELI